MRTATTYKEASVFFETTYTKKSVARKIRINYTTFGAPLPGRTYNSSEYRFGYNKGSEKDDEISGAGNHFTTFYREGDTRLITWWGADPMADFLSFQSPYSYMNGNPINGTDPNGGFFQELKNWTLGRGWKSNEAYKFGKTHSDWSYEWQGSKLTGRGTYSHIDKSTEGGNMSKGVNLGTYEFAQFDAVQDIPHFSFFKFEGELIIGTNFFDQSSSFTPGPFVVASRATDYYKKINFTIEKDHFHHEIGHIEQFKDLGPLYYPIIAIPSALEYNIRRDVKKHDNFYTEKWANTLSIHRFGQFSDHSGYPSYKRVYFPFYKAFQK